MSDWARLYKLQRQMGLGLPYHLRNTMDKDQQADTDKLKERGELDDVINAIEGDDDNV